MDYPDSAGIDCTVNLHNIHLPCFNVGTVPNHPNYYLGRLVGSPCDTLTSVKDLTEHDFKFSVSPNPNNGNFRIMYLLPQNKSGKLEIFDINGRVVYSQNLLRGVHCKVFHCHVLQMGFIIVVLQVMVSVCIKKLVVFNE
ncbi:MAG: T9SS type A sorting domain-containing protein [Bacteroidia bacterium]|nr:T9SS type A sorting domain-containing protein [Bacteroidia bacterium]